MIYESIESKTHDNSLLREDIRDRRESVSFTSKSCLMGVVLTFVSSNANGLISFPATVSIPLSIPSTKTVPDPAKGSNNA